MAYRALCDETATTAGSFLCRLRQLVKVQSNESHAEAGEEDDQVLVGDGHNPESKFVTECNEFL